MTDDETPIHPNARIRWKMMPMLPPLINFCFFSPSMFSSFNSPFSFITINKIPKHQNCRWLSVCLDVTFQRPPDAPSIGGPPLSSPHYTPPTSKNIAENKYYVLIFSDENGAFSWKVPRHRRKCRAAIRSAVPRVKSNRWHRMPVHKLG